MSKKKLRRLLNRPYFKNINNIFLFVILLLLPTQLGKYFFFDFSFINGIRVDYLSINVFLIDIIIILAGLFNIRYIINKLTQKSFLIFYFLLIINAVLSTHPEISFFKILRLLEIIVVFYLFQLITEKIIVVYGFLFSSLLTFILSVSQFVTKQSIQGIFYFFGERLLNLSTPSIAKASINGIEFLRPYGTFSHPNSMAGFFLLVYFFFLNNKKYIKNIYLYSLILFLSTSIIFLSFSKVAIITYLLLNTIYLIKIHQTKCKVCVMAKLIIPIFLVFIVLKAQTDPLTILKRLELIIQSFVILKDNLLFGVGIGNYLYHQANFSSQYVGLFNQPVHNIFLLKLSELGIFICIYIIYNIRPLIKKIIKNNYLILLVIIITGFFDHYWITLLQNGLIIGVLLSITVLRPVESDR